ncbi:MAG: hypothetical protein M1826_001828 [Phylliscum demangeonii]|nr:MAG: hypothetical protein M1826_001828 [Phylliscum demangeonii]
MMRKTLSLTLPAKPRTEHDTGQSRSPIKAGAGLATSPAALSPTKPMTPAATQSNPFLVALAAQERRVFELREELQRAETDLADLKRQWALREARKKRDDLHHLQRLQPLTTTLAQLEGTAADDESLAAMDTRAPAVHERRNTLGVVGSRPTRRTVIAGQKHTRALSLLSPERLHPPDFLAPTAPAPDEPVKAKRHSDGSPTTARRMIAVGGAASPKVGVAGVRASAPPPTPSKDALLRTGRQLAEDFKEGLWMFIEDLRHATVGDESVSARHGGRPRAGRTPLETVPDASPATTSSTTRTTSTANSPASQPPSTPVRQPLAGRAARWTGAWRAEAPAQKAALLEVGEVFWREPAVFDKRERESDPAPRRSRRGSAPGEGHRRRVSSADDDDHLPAWETWDSPKPSETSVLSID